MTIKQETFKIIVIITKNIIITIGTIITIMIIAIINTDYNYNPGNYYKTIIITITAYYVIQWKWYIIVNAGYSPPTDNLHTVALTNTKINM